jgi:hypothetical protein
MPARDIRRSRAASEIDGKLTVDGLRSKENSPRKRHPPIGRHPLRKFPTSPQSRQQAHLERLRGGCAKVLNGRAPKYHRSETCFLEVFREAYVERLTVPHRVNPRLLLCGSQ